MLNFETNRFFARFKYPAETARHIATILGFPSKCSLPPVHYRNACQEISQLAKLISEFEPVRLYTKPEDFKLAQSMISNKDCGPFGVDIIPFDTNHLWVRDTAPVYVIGSDSNQEDRNRRLAINFRFHEWGNKVSPEHGLEVDYEWPDLGEDEMRKNATFAKRVIENDFHPSPVTCIESKVRLEGGAIVCDGDGTLIASESSIIDNERNSGLSKQTIEEELSRLLGVEKFIWFPGFKDLDVTDVHADAEVQFVRPGVVVLSRPHQSAPKEWWKVYEQVKRVLTLEKDAKFRQLQIHTIDEPNPKFTKNSKHEDPATNYVNFYFVNGGLIIPGFGDPEKDLQALETMKELCSDRIVKQLHVNALPLNGGVIHCSTQPVIDISGSF